MSCRVVSCCVVVVSRRVASCRVVSCRVVSCRVVSCPVKSRHVASRHVMSRPVTSSVLALCASRLSCRVVSRHASRHVISSHAMEKAGGLRSPNVARLSLATRTPPNQARRRSLARRWCEGPAREDAANKNRGRQGV